MVDSVTSVSSNGLREWVIQRVSAIVMAVYAIFLIGFMLMHPNMEYMQWQQLFANLGMKIFTVLFLLSLLFHVWIGLWIVFTDYVKVTCLRFVLQVLVILTLISCLVWGISIIWSVV